MPAGDITLTPRQRQVVELLAAGLSRREIARRLRVQVNTVNQHIMMAGQLVPGDLPAGSKLKVWWRTTQGTAVLTGDKR